MNRSAQQIQGVLHDEKQATWKKYALLTVGEASWLRLLNYELRTMLFSAVPGALGFVLRRRFYRSLFARCGRGVMIGRNVTVRGAGRISLGDGVLIDDNCVLDARGPEARLDIGPGVVLSRNSIVRTRGRELVIGAGTDIGWHRDESRIESIRDALCAAGDIAAASRAESLAIPF